MTSFEIRTKTRTKEKKDEIESSVHISLLTSTLMDVLEKAGYKIKYFSITPYEDMED